MKLPKMREIIYFLNYITITKQLCRLRRKGLQEIFNMVQVNSVRRDLRRTAHVMQLDIDPYKAGSIVVCRIVYVIFLITVIS